VDDGVQALLAAGIPPQKLGLGMPFSGAVWTGGIVAGTTQGVTAPEEGWASTPAMQADIPYHVLMDTFGQFTPMWDPVARVPFWSMDFPGSARDQFVSFDNEQSIAEKCAYVKSKRLGGAMLWQLEGGYRADQPTGAQQQPLLEAVRQALR